MTSAETDVDNRIKVNEMSYHYHLCHEPLCNVRAALKVQLLLVTT